MTAASCTCQIVARTRCRSTPSTRAPRFSRSCSGPRVVGWYRGASRSSAAAAGCFVSNQDSDAVDVFSVDPGVGHIAPTGATVAIPEPDDLVDSKDQVAGVAVLAKLPVHPVLSVRFSGFATSPAVVTHGPHGQNVSAPLARPHWISSFCRSRERRRSRRRSRLAGRHHRLRPPFRPRNRASPRPRLRHLAKAGDRRADLLEEHDRPLGQRHPRLLGMGPVVERDAVDRARRRDRGEKLDLVQQPRLSVGGRPADDRQAVLDGRAVAERDRMRVPDLARDGL